MKHNNLPTLLLLSILLLFTACQESGTNYIIGVSQCSEDSWRSKLQDELDMATYFNEGVSVRFASAHDDSKLQAQQIDSLVASGIDLLIVSPNQVDLLNSALDRVYDAGIPVILFDRKSNSSKYTAFMGADNYRIGEMLGHYVAGKLGGKGSIVEIGGLKGSSPAMERHNGFAHALKRYPDMQIVCYQSGDWTEASGEIAMRRILKDYDGPIDAVYGGNDRMAVGARRVMKEAGKDHKDVIYVGVDALPKGGMRQVADSILTASGIYPTHGDELMALALRILNGEEYQKETMMQSSVVTYDNAPVLLLQHEEVVRQANYLRKMHSQAGRMHEAIRSQEMVIALILIFVLITVIMLAFIVRALQQKHRLNEELHASNNALEKQRSELSDVNQQLSALNSQLSATNSELQKEKELVERQRDELEEQRDKVIEMSLYGPKEGAADGAEGSDVLSGGEKTFRRENEFLSKFIASVEKHLSDSDLSVEDIGSEMCLSRVQLYRKVKALTGKSPVEVIREERLRRGHQLLADSSLTISEIAYRVGFSSPSYFTKCYKDMFGKSPTDVQKM